MNYYNLYLNLNDDMVKEVTRVFDCIIQILSLNNTLNHDYRK